MDLSKRLERDELYMQIAKLFAMRGTCERKKVGCVIVKDNRIICSGYNGTLAKTPHCHEIGCDLAKPCQHAIHAEANAISFAARKGIILEDSHLYSTYGICFPCAQLIIQSGIKKVTFSEDYRYYDGISLLKQNDVLVWQYGNQA